VAFKTHHIIRSDSAPMFEAEHLIGNESIIHLTVG
jgi:hypothetical protein